MTKNNGIKFHSLWRSLEWMLSFTDVKAYVAYELQGSAFNTEPLEVRVAKFKEIFRIAKNKEKLLKQKKDDSK